MITCKNCGAPVEGVVCHYCGTGYIINNTSPEHAPYIIQKDNPGVIPLEADFAISIEAFHIFNDDELRQDVKRMLCRDLAEKIYDYVDIKELLDDHNSFDIVKKYKARVRILDKNFMF